MRLIFVSFVASLCLAFNLFAHAQTISPAFDGDVKVNVAGLSGMTGTIAIFAATPPAVTCAATSTPVLLAPNTSAAVLSGDQTTVILNTPLAQGQIICAVVISAAGVAGNATAPLTVGPPASPPGFDWGLVRAYFTFGSLLSQQDNQFSHQDLFMAFHLDKTYLQAGNLDASGKHSFRPGLNTFFETRLTALPVAVQPCTSNTANSTSTTTCSNSDTGTSGSGGGSGTPPDQTQIFLNSQKSARLQFGLYSPFLWDRWNVTEKKNGITTAVPYALYIAPMVKTGFDTSLNGLNQTQQQGSTPNAVQSVGNSSEFYKFYDFGFRLGHYRLSADKTIAHDILSYLDVTWGRFSNMASLLCPQTLYNGDGTCGTVAAPPKLAWSHDYRLNVEGLLEVPATHGFSVGFSANVAPKGIGSSVIQGTNYFHIRPQDDLRFLFAYKIDISKFAAKLSPQ